jgi:hypothetical protein
MTTTKRKVVNAILNILALPLKAVLGFFKAVFIPPPKAPEYKYRPRVGEWWLDNKRKWHPRVYMYDRNEPPPSA